MTNPPLNKTDECHGTKVKNLKKAFSTAGSSLWKILCPQFRTVITGIKNLFVVQVSVLEPILALEEVFVQNFVVFPANTLKSTVSGISDAGGKLREFGVDRGCSSHNKIFESIDSTTGPLRDTAKFFGNISDSAEAEIERSRNRIAALNEFIDKVSTDFLDIQCP